MHFLIRETLRFNLMYVAACYPMGTTISKTSSLFTALLQHYKLYCIAYIHTRINKNRISNVSAFNNKNNFRLLSY